MTISETKYINMTINTETGAAECKAQGYTSNLCAVLPQFEHIPSCFIVVDIHVNEFDWDMHKNYKSQMIATYFYMSTYM